MRRALRHAARALVAAGALGLARPSPAQTVVYPPASAPAESAAARLGAMKVELALLADSAAFPYPLSAHPAGSAVELRGATPTAAARDHALAVARRHTGLPVVDAVEVRPDAMQKSEKLSPEVVRQGAAEVLSRGFGQASRGWEIRADDDGVVRVSGPANSVEEKLAAGRMLRQVRGCRGAGNHLLVSPVMRAGRMVTLVTADGSLTVPGMLTNLDGAGQESVAAETQPTAAPTPRPVVVPAAATGTPAWKPAVRVPSPSPSSVPSASPRSPYAGRAEADRQVVTRAALPDAPPPQWTPPPPSDGLALPRVMPSYDAGVTRTQFATSPYAGSAPANPRPFPTPTVTAESTPPAQAPAADKGVDLLATPELPRSWAQKKTAKPKETAKSKETTQGKFATARPDLESQTTADQLLALPAEKAPAPSGGKTAAAPAKPLGSTAPWLAADAGAPRGKAAAASTRTTAKVMPAVTSGAEGRVVPAGHRSEMIFAEAAHEQAPAPVAQPWTLPMTWVPYIHALAAIHSPVIPPMQRVPEPPGGWQPAHAPAPSAAPPSPAAGTGLPGRISSGRPIAKPTHGVVVFAEERHPDGERPAVRPVGHQDKVAGAGETSPSKLKQKVEAACGPKARRVRVETGRDGVTRVEVFVATDAAAKEVTQQVLRVPELSSTAVRFSVTVGP